MHLFIDTNILLSFYHLTSDDLEELRKLAVLLKQKQVAFYLTDQVVDEFARNREAKIADAIKRLKEQKLNLQFPQICKDYPEYASLRELQKSYDEKHSALLMKLSTDIAAKNLKADATIEELFSAATRLSTNERIVDRARLRLEVGNPPGKDGSLGDAINWELLLEKAPAEQDLYFVTEDRDYCSALDDNLFKDFLVNEWKTKKKAALRFHKRLSSVFKDKFPDIKLATELEKDLLIKQFVGSPNFATTHAVVAKLAKHDFSGAQASDIAAAALTNNQINWILTDEDLTAFISALLGSYGKHLDPEVANALAAQIARRPPPEPDLDVPF